MIMLVPNSSSAPPSAGLYVFDLSALRPRDVAPALKVDSVMQDALGLVRRLRRQRAEETPGLPPTPSSPPAWPQGLPPEWRGCRP